MARRGGPSVPVRDRLQCTWLDARLRRIPRSVLSSEPKLGRNCIHATRHRPRAFYDREITRRIRRDSTWTRFVPRMPDNAIHRSVCSRATYRKRRSLCFRYRGHGAIGPANLSIKCFAIPCAHLSVHTPRASNIVVALSLEDRR